MHFVARCPVLADPRCCRACLFAVLWFCTSIGTPTYSPAGVGGVLGGLVGAVEGPAGRKAAVAMARVKQTVPFMMLMFAVGSAFQCARIVED